jgi:hypothetical protein
MATQAEVATIAQLAATLLAAPRDSAAASVGANTIDDAIRVAMSLYDSVGRERDAAANKSRGQ